MALPPTYIYRYFHSNPERMFQMLKRAGLLSEQTLQDNGVQMLKTIKNAVKTHYDQMEEGMTGPNANDITADVIYAYLNKYGQMLCTTPLYQGSSKVKWKVYRIRLLARFKALFK